MARAAQPLMHPATQYPLAQEGQVTFYAVTDAGVFAAAASQDDLAGNRNPFSALAAAMQAILSEYRRLPESKR